MEFYLQATQRKQVAMDQVTADIVMGTVEAAPPTPTEGAKAGLPTTTTTGATAVLRPTEPHQAMADTILMAVSTDKR